MLAELNQLRNLASTYFIATTFHGADLDDPVADGLLPFDWYGVFSLIATGGIVFSYLGFRQVVKLKGETRNPQCRKYPIANIGPVSIAGVLYIAVLIAFITKVIFLLQFPGWQ